MKMLAVLSFFLVSTVLIQLTSAVCPVPSTTITIRATLNITGPPELLEAIRTRPDQRTQAQNDSIDAKAREIAAQLATAIPELSIQFVEFFILDLINNTPVKRDTSADSALCKLRVEGTLPPYSSCSAVPQSVIADNLEPSSRVPYSCSYNIDGYPCSPSAF